MKEQLVKDFLEAIEGSSDEARMIGIIVEPDHENKKAKIRIVSLCPPEEEARNYRQTPLLFILCGIYLFFHRLFGGKASKLGRDGE